MTTPSKNQAALARFRDKGTPTRNKAALERIQGGSGGSSRNASGGSQQPNFNSIEHGAINVDPSGNPTNFSQQANFSMAGGRTGFAQPPAAWHRAVEQIHQPSGWKKIDVRDLVGRGIDAIQTRFGQDLHAVGIENRWFTPAPNQFFTPASAIGFGASGFSKAGTVGLKAPAATNSAQRIAANKATEKATASMMTKIVGQYKKNPLIPTMAVVGGLLTMVGTYPWAGHERSEAMIGLNMARRRAEEAGDHEAMEMVTALRDEMLNPDVWGAMARAVPFANVIYELENFFKVQQITAIIDDRIYSDMRRIDDEMKNFSTEQGASAVNPDGTPMSPPDPRDRHFELIREEKAREERAVIDYYNQERMKLLEWEREAKREQREEDAAFWAAEREKQRKKEEEDRQAVADFWYEYRKRLQKMQEDSRPSKLNFGLL